MDPNQNLNHQQQAWNFQDGSVSMQYQQSTWSSSGRTGMNIPPPSMPTLQSPQMPLLGNGFHSMAQQMHAHAMAHHQGAIQHMSNVHQSIRANMFGMQRPPMLVPGQPLMPQTIGPQTMQLEAPGDRLAIMPGHVEEADSSEEESTDSDDEEVALHEEKKLRMQQEMADLERQRQALELQNQMAAQQHQQAAQQRALEDRLAKDKHKMDQERRVMEDRYLADQQSIQRQGAKMGDRLRKLEENEIKDRAEREAKDAEMRQLREENNRMAQQRYQDAEKHQQQMADLARMQASQPKQVAPVFDNSALEKVIREVQSRQLSKTDIEKVIKEGVADQLQGMARQKDLDAATSQMRSALKKVSKGASLDEVQSAVNAELGKAVSELVSKTEQRQLAIEDVSNAAPNITGHKVSCALVRDKGKERVKSPEGRNTLEPSVAAKHVPSELPDDFPDNASQIGAWEQSRSPSSKPMKALPTIAEDEPVNRSLVHKGKQKSSLIATPHAASGGPSAIPNDALVRKDKQKSTTTPTPINPEVAESSSLSDALIRKGKKLSAPLTPAMPELPVVTVFSEALVYEGKEKKASAVAALDHTQASITAQETHMVDGALVRRPRKDKPRTESPVVEGTLIKKSKADKAASMAVPTTTESALVRKSKHDKATEAATSDALVKGAKHDENSSMPASLTGGEVSGYGSVTLADIANQMSSQSHPFGVPEDFPDTASQISTWERSRAAGGPNMSAGSPARPQIQAATGMMPGSDLVRSGKVKKDSRK